MLRICNRIDAGSKDNNHIIPKYSEDGNSECVIYMDTAVRNTVLFLSYTLNSKIDYQWKTQSLNGFIGHLFHNLLVVKTHSIGCFSFVLNVCGLYEILIIAVGQ